ncbi:MAG: PIN domain-containing protein [Nanoarchaeota archaeon]
MTKIIVDSFAWIEYLTATNKGSTVKKLIEDENNEIFTHILSLAEISSRLSRSGIKPEESINIISLNSIIINLNNIDSTNAGKLHSEIREKIKDFGLVDAFVLLMSRRLNAKVLTGDSHFKNFKEAIMI